MRINGGQNFVQASNNNGRMLGRGAMILGSIFGAKAQVEARKHLISHQADEQIRVNEAAAKNKAIYDVAGKYANNEFAGQSMFNFHDKATERYTEDHPDVISGKKQVGEYVRPLMADAMSRIEQTPGGYKFSSVSGKLMQEGRSGNEASRTGEGDEGNNNEDLATGKTPPKSEVRDALHKFNAVNPYPFVSSVGESGRFSPTSFDKSGTPTYSEENAEIDLGRNKEFGMGGNK